MKDMELWKGVLTLGYMVFSGRGIRNYGENKNKKLFVVLHFGP